MVFGIAYNDHLFAGVNIKQVLQVLYLCWDSKWIELIYVVVGGPLIIDN